MSETVYRASVLHALGPRELVYLAEGELVVDAAGAITALRACGTSALEPGARLVELPGRLLIPGLVDAHVHIPQIDVIGVASESLLAWLEDYVFASELACADPAVAGDRAERSFHGMLSAGTTACAAYATSHTQATELALVQAERIGIRAVVGKVLMDRGAPAGLLQERGPALRETETLIERWSGAANGRLEVAVTPRFALSCSPELLRDAGALARKHGCPVQTHLAENPSEIERTRELFPERADYTEVYEHAGLVGERSLLAHCIHMSEGEFGRLARAGAAAVHCPDSNFYLHSGRFPLARARDQGVTVALGSDVGAGTCFSIVEAMRLGNYTQPGGVDPRLLFYLATQGGADALGWGQRIGNFRPGKQADFAVIDAAPLLTSAAASDDPGRLLLSRLVHRGQSAPIEAVYIAGRKVFG
ncbi:guanine deaminase [Haliangium ochraceum]|uniref:Guanine deaminase n=1 Tax=Haliangium ochraceum (strain DSM 14365 / JCM 11303 / SMP-2) TaxID=502025 RepID=D0LJU0_HALO1|nr:guanine deaminase [Haliangium ochraceum]ACY18447.1 guanine deaminase [Haliangium ochraceum DSM 14365]